MFDKSLKFQAGKGNHDEFLTGSGSGSGWAL